MDVNNRMRLLFLIGLAFVAAHSSVARGQQCSFTGLADSYSSTDDPVRLSGTPGGGRFIGPGIRGDSFDPALAGRGTHTITYTDTSRYRVDRSGPYARVQPSSEWRTVPARSGGELQDADDDISPPINIGFDFHFFGETYNQLYVSSNGEVLFTPYEANPWRFTRLPDRDEPNNMIAVLRMDLDSPSPVKSEIKYRVLGSAPNRVFVVNFEYKDPRDPNADDYGEAPQVETQLKLFETSQRIEIHTGEKGPFWDWAVQGIENRDGTRAYYVPGRHVGIWLNRENDFVAFIPCTSSQTVSVDGAYSVSGSVSGLVDGNELVLQLNGGTDLTIDNNGRFGFAEPLEDGDSYEVTVLHQPSAPPQTCTVSNGSGIIGSPVSDISVDCDAAFHSVSYRAGPNGSILGEADQTVEHGADGSEVTAMPDAGYHFIGWSDGSTANPRQDEDVTRSLWLEALFAADTTGPPPEPGEPQRDKVAPVIQGVSGVSAHATGLVTDASVLGPDAVDNVDGPVPVSLTGEQTLLRPGRYFLTWAAEDSAGNRAEARRRLDIYPIVTLTRDQVQPEGGSAQVSILLNGNPPRYPLTVGYRVSGSASSDDHNLAGGTVTFQEGDLEQTLTVDLLQDDVADSGETLIITLDAASTTAGAANFGTNSSHTITIVEKNLAPTVDISTFQAGQRTQLVTKDAGAVIAVATVQDPNPGDTHVYQWEYPPYMEVVELDPFTLRIDPGRLDIGEHRIAVTVTEEGSAPLSARDQETFLMAESRASLNGQADSDGDGRLDRAEGFSDLDGDSQPDHLDPVALPHVVSAHAQDGFLYMIETEPGLRFELGEVALRYGADGAGLVQSELAEDENHSLGIDSVVNLGGYVDFELRGLPAGGRARLVLPQYKPVPEQAVYRKYMNEVWSDFVETGGDALASAPGAEGACPPPGSAEYEAGLEPGHWCVQLTLTDGGPNDTDGEVNGVIRDPGGVGAYAGSNEFTTSGGGGALGLWGIALVGLAGMFGRCFRRGRRRAMLAFLWLVMWAPLGAGAADWLTTYHPVYVQTGFGYVNTKIDNNDINSRFAAEGYAVETSSADGSRYGWSLGVGYLATDWLQVELDYIDLGEVEVTFQSESIGRGLADVYPESGHGGAASLLYRLPLGERLAFNARVGGFIWKGEYSTDESAQWIGEDEQSRKDFFYGVGFSYTLTPSWSVTGELQRFEMEDPALFASVGLEFRFLEWLHRR